MIAGKKFIKLTQENVLKKISSFDIFKMYMPADWEVNKLTSSPFREDKHPSFLISNRLGELGYIDYGNTSYKGDSIKFVQQLFNLKDYNEALKKIDFDFGLRFLNNHSENDYKKITASYKQPEHIGKRYVKIQIQPKKFTKEDLAYWNLYHQDISDLKRENIYSINKIFLNKKRFSFNEKDLIFGYYYDGAWKVYRPNESRKRKWLPNNVPITTLDGKDVLKKDKPAFINKSKKDYMVVRKLLPESSCAVQNEGMSCFSPENIKFFKENSSRQILSFDSDTVGVKNSQEITELLGYDYCNVPKKYLAENINDWAALSKKYGMKTIEEYFRTKKLI